MTGCEEICPAPKALRTAGFCKGPSAGLRLTGLTAVDWGIAGDSGKGKEEVCGLRLIVLVGDGAGVAEPGRGGNNGTLEAFGGSDGLGKAAADGRGGDIEVMLVEAALAMRLGTEDERDGEVGAAAGRLLPSRCGGRGRTPIPEELPSADIVDPAFLGGSEGTGPGLGGTL